MLELRQVDVHRRDVRILWSVSLRVEDGKIVEYRVTLEVLFILES